MQRLIKPDPARGLPTQKHSYKVELKAGQTYYYCTCGRSKNQPWCDGSHKGSAFQPIEFAAEESQTYKMCGCRQSATAGRLQFCDSSHKNIDW